MQQLKILLTDSLKILILYIMYLYITQYLYLLQDGHLLRCGLVESRLVTNGGLAAIGTAQSEKLTIGTAQSESKTRNWPLAPHN